VTGVVDSHCHVSANWYEPASVLLAQMDRAGVEHAVLIQLLGCYDNQYLLDCAARCPDRFSAVVAVDVARHDALQDLERCRDAGAAGVRLRPTARSPGADPLAIWHCAADLGLPVSCVGNPASFNGPELDEVLRTIPGLTVVLEHLGGTSTADAGDAERAARARTWQLAKYPSVCMKVPGLGEFEPRVTPFSGAQMPLDQSSARQVLVGAIAQFGVERLMWGSDFPVVASREGYANALNWCRDLVCELTGGAAAQIFGTNALAVFRRRKSLWQEPGPRPA
jgi:L-fuconolactonase